MLAQEASKIGVHPYFLDKSSEFPAGLISQRLVEGDFKNYDDVLAFGRTMDIISIEIENVNVEALTQLEKDGHQVYPSPASIAIIKDKGIQKQFYQDNKLPSSAFQLFENKEAVLKALDEGRIQLPFVQKSRQAGYDGKGVLLVNNREKLDQLMDTACLVEELVDIEKEIAIIVARNASGDTRFFDPVEMVFDPEGNLLDYLLCPAEIDSKQYEYIRELAYNIVKAMEYIGLLAIELFVTKDGEILINEIAPRTHNSGHHSIDACQVSQFNMQLRCLLDLSLPEPRLKYKYAGIVNLLGDKDSAIGPAHYFGLRELLSMEGVFPHIYGKDQVKPLRKMGHVNVLADSKEALLEKIAIIKKTISIHV
jgi:5-(carboxyamino)imidazole ribonucleotide synthase